MQNFLRVIRWTNKRLKFHILQFFDDTSTLENMEAKNICTAKGILRWFELISELKVNFYKSKLDVIESCEELVRKYVSMLNCSTIRIPYLYRRILVRANQRKMSMGCNYQ